MYLDELLDDNEELENEDIEVTRRRLRRGLTLLEKRLEKIAATHASWRGYLAALTSEMLER